MNTVAALAALRNIGFHYPDGTLLRIEWAHPQLLNDGPRLAATIAQENAALANEWGINTDETTTIILRAATLRGATLAAAHNLPGWPPTLNAIVTTHPGLPPGTTDTMTVPPTGAAALREWVDAHSPDGVSWLVTRSSTTPTGGQAWRSVRDGAAPGSVWTDRAIAAVYNDPTGYWWPLEPGDVIIRTTGPHQRVTFTRQRRNPQ